MAITADISLMRSDVCRAGGAMRDYEAGRGRGERASGWRRAVSVCVWGGVYGGVAVGLGVRVGGWRERYGVRHQEEIALLPPALRW